MRGPRGRQGARAASISSWLAGGRANGGLRWRLVLARACGVEMEGQRGSVLTRGRLCNAGRLQHLPNKRCNTTTVMERKQASWLLRGSSSPGRQAQLLTTGGTGAPTQPPGHGNVPGWTPPTRALAPGDNAGYRWAFRYYSSMELLDAPWTLEDPSDCCLDALGSPASRQRPSSGHHRRSRQLFDSPATHLSASRKTIFLGTGNTTPVWRQWTAGQRCRSDLGRVSNWTSPRNWMRLNLRQQIPHARPSTPRALLRELVFNRQHR